MPLDYREKYYEAYKRNVKDVSRAAQEGEIDDKIDNFCSLHGFEKEYIMEI